MKLTKCESCGKHPAFYFVDSWIKSSPASKICCVCVDQMITKCGQWIKEELNIREIPPEIKDDKSVCKCKSYFEKIGRHSIMCPLY